MSNNRFFQRNLISDIAQSAKVTDPDAVNPWGLVVVEDGNFWVNLNGTSLLKLYSKRGQQLKSFPVPDGPTGLVKVPKPVTGGPKLVFVTEGGVIGVYNPSLPNPIKTVFSDPNSVYKGVTILDKFLYVANFNNFKVDVFDLQTFVNIPQKTIVDPALTAAGFSPFNVYSDGRTLFISYAFLDPVEKKDDVPGIGHGYINVFANGMLTRIANRSPLNSPWGLLRIGHKLYVGNFGDGFINIYDLFREQCKNDKCDNKHCKGGTLRAEFCEPLKNKCGSAIQIDGLWGIAQETDSKSSKCDGDINFAAGIQGENHGLIGILVNLGNVDNRK